MDEMLTRILSCIGNKHGAQKELAEHLGIHPNVITNWKNGTNKSYRGYINEIADFYGVSIDYLLTGEQKEKTPATDGERKKKLRSVARLESADITPELDKNIADYIDYLLSKKDREE